MSNLEQYHGLTNNIAPNSLPDESHPRYADYKKMEDASIAILNDKEGWSHWKTDKNVVIESKQVPGMPVPFVRGTTSFSTDNIELVHRAIEAFSTRPKWDTSLIGSTLDEKITPACYTQYSCFSSPWPVSNRYFRFITAYRPYEDGSMIRMYKSIPLPDPVSKEHEKKYSGFVLGDLITCVYKLSIDPNTKKVNITYIVALDPSGSIPGWVVNTTLPNLVSVLNTIEDFLTTKGDILKTAVEDQGKFYDLLRA